MASRIPYPENVFKKCFQDTRLANYNTVVERAKSQKKLHLTTQPENKDPLILPPDYNTLPSPNSIKELKKNNDNKINKILKLPDQSSGTSTGSSSVEESIINNIRK